MPSYSKTFSLLFVLALILIMGSPMGEAVSTGKLVDLGYSYQHYSRQDHDMPWVTFKESYSHVTTNGTIIGQVEIQVPYNKDGQLLYFNFQLTDGSTHKGSYQGIGANQYILYLDGTSLSGNYSYDTIDQLMQWMGVYDTNSVWILYTSNLSNRSNSALYVLSQPNFGTTIDPRAQVLLLPLSNAGVGIKSITMSSNYQMTAHLGETTGEDLIDFVIGQYELPDKWNNSDTSSSISLSPYLDKLTSFVNNLLVIATSAVELVLLFFIILKFVIDPFNIILILILFEEFAFIMALSGKGDTLDALGKFINYNVTMLNFAVFLANGMVQILSATVGALGTAVQAGAQLAQVGTNAVQGLVSWLIVLFKIIPK